MKKRFLKAFVIIGFLMVAVLPAFMASNGFILINGGSSGPDCSPAWGYAVDILTDTVDDSAGRDHFAVVMVDGVGTLLDIDLFALNLGDWDDVLGTIDYTYAPEITVDPVTFALFDIPDSSGVSSGNLFKWIVRNGTLMNYDSKPSWDMQDCDPPPVDLETAFTDFASLFPLNIWHTDGRVNAKQGYAPLAIFPDGDGGMEVFATVPPTYEAGELLLTIDATAITAAFALNLGPTEQIVIAEANGVSVYMTGEGWIKVEQIGVFGMEFDPVMLGWTDPVSWDAPVLPYVLPIN